MANIYVVTILAFNNEINASIHFDPNCNDDTHEVLRVLASNRKAWHHREEAEAYARTCADSRIPWIEQVMEIPTVKPFDELTSLHFSDNECTKNYTSIWANGWDKASLTAVKQMCPDGNFTCTTYISTDETLTWGTAERAQIEQYGWPISCLYRGAYYRFPLDDNGAKLLVALGLTSELMKILASNRSHWIMTGT